MYGVRCRMSSHKWDVISRIETILIPHRGGYKAVSRADPGHVEYKCRRCGLRVGTGLGTNIPKIQRAQDASCDDVLVRSVMET